MTPWGMQMAFIHQKVCSCARESHPEGSPGLAELAIPFYFLGSCSQTYFILCQCFPSRKHAPLAWTVNCLDFGWELLLLVILKVLYSLPALQGSSEPSLLNNLLVGCIHLYKIRFDKLTVIWRPHMASIVPKMKINFQPWPLDSGNHHSLLKPAQLAMPANLTLRHLDPEDAIAIVIAKIFIRPFSIEIHAALLRMLSNVQKIPTALRACRFKQCCCQACNTRCLVHSWTLHSVIQGVLRQYLHSGDVPSARPFCISIMHWHSKTASPARSCIHAKAWIMLWA